MRILDLFFKREKNPPPLCEDCKWLIEKGRFSRCSSPRANNSLVTSRLSYEEMTYAGVERSLGNCGEIGRYFESKHVES